MKTGVSRILLIATGTGLALALGFLDYVTGQDIGVFSLYLIPTVLCAWRGGLALGLGVAAISALLWLSVDIITRQYPVHTLVHAWNLLLAAGTLGCAAWLVARFREVLARETLLARTDPLTGALNLRAFEDVLEGEIARCRRYHHPLSLAYFDLDNLKQVNDRLGHAAGDRLLMAIVQALRTHLRRTDIVARLGGDEFAILLPEAGAAAARDVSNKVLEAIRGLPAEAGLSTTLSIGLVTCEKEFPEAEELIRRADQLMYEVKRAGRNAVRQQQV
jgi:diguanylate cyclase (GGDEF)-like protein